MAEIDIVDRRRDCPRNVIVIGILLLAETNVVDKPAEAVVAYD